MARKRTPASLVPAQPVVPGATATWGREKVLVVGVPPDPYRTQVLDVTGRVHELHRGKLVVVETHPVRVGDER